MYRVLTADEVVGAQAVYDRYADSFTVASVPPERDAILREIGAYDAYITPLKVRTDREILDAGTNLRALFTMSTGLDHIDLEYAAQKGIAVYGMKNDRAFLDNVTATAELALALMLGVERRVPWAFDAAKRGVWARDLYRGHQMRGKTLGILGYGRLGTIMAQYGQALRMEVIACDIRPFEAEGVRQVSFDELLARSDVLSVHVHLNDDTRGMIGEREFARMKSGAVLVNTSRGAIVDERAMLDALERGTLAGAGVDVIDGEWMADITQHPVVRYASTHENLLISPHVGGCCYEAQLDSLENTLQKVRDFFGSGCDPMGTETLRRSRMA